MSYLIQQNIKLEKFTELDFAVYFELVKNIKVMQMITERALTLEEAHTEFAKILSKNTYDVALGNYMLLPEYWGKGIASQVVTFLIEHAKQQAYLKDLMAIIDPENIASRKILINNGFHSQEFKDFDGLAGEILLFSL